MRNLPSVYAAGVIILLLLPVDRLAGAQDFTVAHFRHREHLSDYAGPEDSLGLGDGEEVLIGYFGPSEGGSEGASDLWRAANLAIEEENQAGGFRGKPFRLVSAWSEQPWSTGISEMTRMVYSRDILAILGSVDGSSTHLVEQLAVKARISVLNPSSSDKTVNLANVPWIFSCLPGEHLYVPLLVHELLRRVGDRPIVLIAANDHDSRVFVRELLAKLREQGRAPALHLVIEAGDELTWDFQERVRSSRAEAVVLAAGPVTSSRLVERLRAGSFEGWIFGTPGMGRREFLDAVTSPDDRIVFPYLTSTRTRGRFPEVFESRYGHSPDYAAIQTYDAARFMAAVIRRSGLSRTRIREQLRQSAPWLGTAGLLDWDPLGQNRRLPGLVTLDRFGIRPLPPALSGGTVAPTATSSHH